MAFDIALSSDRCEAAETLSRTRFLHRMRKDAAESANYAEKAIKNDKLLRENCAAGGRVLAHSAAIDTAFGPFVPALFDLPVVIAGQ